MRIFIVVVLLAMSVCRAQEPGVNSQQTAAQDQAQPAVAPDNQIITIPVGTRIPMTLASPITVKGRAGNAVRAVTAFPISVGTQLAIPAGTYVDGVIDKVSRGGSSGPTVEMHFTRLLYHNGYSVAIDAINTQARMFAPEPDSAELAEFDNQYGGAKYVLAAQQFPPPPQPPPLPPLQAPKSHFGALIGVAVATAVAGIITTVLIAHHRGGSSLLFDTGWQFDMVLQNPLTVDARNVAAAVAPAGMK